MLFTAICTLALILLVLKLMSTPKNKKLPPGPRRWPIVGNIPNLAIIDHHYAHRAMETLALKYGDVMRIGLGVHEACILSSYEAIKDIFPKADATDRHIFEFVTDRSFNKTLGIIWSKGLMWSKMRSYTVKGLRNFGFGKNNCMDTVIEQEVGDLIQFMKKSSEQNNGQVEINNHDFGGSIVNIIWSYIAGYRFPIGDPTIKTILEHGNRVSGIVGSGTLYNALPFLKVIFPNWTKYNEHVVCHREYQEFMREMIQKAKNIRAATTSHKHEPENFIEAFLEEIEKINADPDSIFTEEQLIVVLMDLVLAGSETMGSSLTWAVAFLALNPEVQVKIRKEVLKVVGVGSIKISDFQRLAYLKATIYESLRKGNIAPSGGPPRTASNDIPYRDYIIPKGSIVMMNLGLILSDKGYWGDPEVFRPERFLDETETKVINAERISIVFGTGKRMCMGESFFWDSAPIYLANLIRTFKIEVISGSEPDLKNPRDGGIQLLHPFPVKLTQLINH